MSVQDSFIEDAKILFVASGCFSILSDPCNRRWRNGNHDDGGYMIFSVDHIMQPTIDREATARTSLPSSPSSSIHISLSGDLIMQPHISAVMPALTRRCHRIPAGTLAASRIALRAMLMFYCFRVRNVHFTRQWICLWKC